MCKCDHAMYIQCFEDADHLQRAMELKFYQGLTNEHYSGNGLYKGIDRQKCPFERCLC